MFLAHAFNARTGRDTSRPFDSAELAASHLLILLRAGGWSDDPAETVRKLVDGWSLTYKGFVYSVEAQPQA